MEVDVESLRRSVARGARPLRVTTHAQVEAFKGGLVLSDLHHVFEHRRVIEQYEEGRVLVYGQAVTARMPVHIVVQDAPDEVVIVTAYVPDRSEWIGYARRRKRRAR
jgi:hypothetical protein